MNGAKVKSGVQYGTPFIKNVKRLRFHHKSKVPTNLRKLRLTVGIKKKGYIYIHENQNSDQLSFVNTININLALKQSDFHCMPTQIKE